MQETKRRSKRGLLLLALVVALAVMALVPASALAAAPSASINGGATVIGSTQVVLTYTGDTTAWVAPPATYVQIQDRYNGGTWTPAAPANVAYVNATTVVVDYTMQSQAAPAVGGTYDVLVTFYSAANNVLGQAIASVTFDNTKTISIIDMVPYGVWGDYATLWFGPNWANAQGDVSFSGAPAHSIVWKVDSGPWHDTLATAFPGANPVTFYSGATNGFHTVSHYGVSEAMLTNGPVTTNTFGWDSVAPRFNFTGLDSTKWYGNAPVNWTAHVTDEPGSGVAPTPTVVLDDGVAPVFTPLEWTPYQYQTKGTITPGAYDAQTFGWFDLDFTASDMVNNVTNLTKSIHFDLVAPHTSYTVDPAGATNFTGWTNKDVTVTFHAMDPGYDVGLGSGVAYTEYVLGDSSSTPPAQSASGTVGDSVSIKENAPTGPVYLWFRSVDKADPANKEVWQKIFIYIDKTAPTLTNDVPSWWINDGQFMQVTGPTPGAKSAEAVVPWLFEFAITFDATDANSGIGPDLIQWRLPNWNNNAWYSLWHQIAPGDWEWFDVYGSAADDGIYTLETKVMDRAGNETAVNTPVKIDTRAPVTDGASGWINGLEPYVLTATDQNTGAGVAATIWRTDQQTPWVVSQAATVGPTLETALPLWPAVQGAIHTVDFGSVDDARPYNYASSWGPSYMFGNLEGVDQTWMLSDGLWVLQVFAGYKTRTVQLDVTPPVVTASDSSPAWSKGPVSVNFSGTDVGAGYAYTEWTIDGVNWNKGETALISGDGIFTLSYRGVDKVGHKSAVQTMDIHVATTAPKVAAKNASVVKGKTATIKFKVTAVTPQASVNILIRKNGHTMMLKRYSMVSTNKWVSRSFTVNLPKGKYLIRVDATDLAGNVQTQRGQATLTVK